MSISDESPGATDPEARSASMWQRTRGDAEVGVQPVPSAAARIVSTGGRGVAQDRLRLLSMYGERYRQAMAVVAGRMQSLGAHASLPVSVIADLAAVHLYLTEEWAWLDKAVIEGTVGVHLPLARCVASGLRRLPTYRGPAIVRTSAVGQVTDWYHENQFVTDRGFWTASTSITELCEGGPGFLVWSLTGRRTGSVDPYTPERLVFLPGTRFKVLQVTEGRWPVVFMREMFPPEPAARRAAGSGSDPTRWVDESTVEELERAAALPPRQTTADVTRERLPGLIVTANAAGQNTGSLVREETAAPAQEPETGEAEETEEEVRAAVWAAWTARSRKI